MIYKTIGSLEGDGFIEKSLLEGKRYYYHACSPSKIKGKLQNIEAMAERLFPELENIYEKSYDAPVLSVKEWIEWIHEIHRDIVESVERWGSYAIYISTTKDSPIRETSLPLEYKKMQKQKELSRYIISCDQRESSDASPYEDITVISKKDTILDENITKFIYKDTVAIIDHLSEVSWTIQNRRFAEYEKKIFFLLRKLLKKERSPQ